MIDLPELAPREKLMVELDLRLEDVWRRLDDESDEIPKEIAAGLIRLAYTIGYVDYATEAKSAQLLKDAPGFSIPGRKR